MRSITRPRIPSAILAMVTLVLVGLTAGPVRAQAIPFVPQPISTSELMELADVMNLSEQQRLAALGVHDDYLRRYREFDDQQVGRLRDAALDIAMEVMDQGFMIPARKDLEEVLRRFEQTVDAGLMVERTLFDQMSTIVTDDQRRGLERARMIRDVEVRQQLMEAFYDDLNPGATIELGAIVRDLDRTPDMRRATDPILDEYCANLLVLANETRDDLEDAAVKVLDLVDELGIREMGMEQMMQLGQDEAFLEDMKARFNELTRPIQATAFDVSGLNLRTFRALAPHIDGAAGDRFRHRFMRAGYGRGYRNHMEWRERFRVAMASGEVPEAARSQLGTQLRALVVQDDTLCDQIADALEAFREYRTIDDFEGGPATEKLQETLEDLSEQRVNLASTATDTLRAAIGVELYASMFELEERVEGPKPGSRTVVIESGGGPAQGRIVIEQEVEEDVTTGYGPAPVGIRDFERLADDLGWDDDEQTLGMAVFDDYRSSYEDLRQAPLEPGDVDADDASPSTKAEWRRARIERLAALDAGLYGDLVILTTDERAATLIGWHRDHRERAAIETFVQGTVPGWGQEEVRVDVYELVRALPLDDAEWSAVTPIIDAYGDQLGPLMDERLEKALERERTQLALEALAGRDDEGGRMRSRMNERNTENWRDVQRLGEQVKQINRETLDRLLRAVSSSNAWDLRLAYNKAAFPNIFAEAEQTEERFERALGLPDLSAGQRDGIDGLRRRFREDFMQVGDRMIELAKARDFTGFERPSRDMIEREIELERLRFDRDETMDRALTRLRLSLTEEQRRLVPGLVRGAGEDEDAG